MSYRSSVNSDNCSCGFFHLGDPDCNPYECAVCRSLTIVSWAGPDPTQSAQYCSAACSQRWNEAHPEYWTPVSELSPKRLKDVFERSGFTLDLEPVTH